MKKVTSFSDIQYIIKNKCDLKQTINGKLHDLPYFSFLRMTLGDVTAAINEGSLFYDLQDC